ncbi:MAG: polyprenyl diphosphate synthase [Bacillota bacterium]|nr:di-trans,poly-cis-decaprenylcistransferase [Candidatus Fermentithermobacillaceae bacterium]
MSISESPHDMRSKAGDDLEESLLKRALSGNIPVHVGIVMDGNGRWAVSRGMKRSEGHRAGVESLKRCLPALLRLGIRFCTFYVFSTENWKRPREEVQFLMDLILEYAKEDRSDFIRQGIRVIPIGRWREMPRQVVQALSRLAMDTASGDKLTVLLAVNYGGRQEIVDAAKELAISYVGREKELQAAGEEEFRQFLYEPSAPDVDLVIRTSGEMRLSNFLLWRAAYAELVFLDVLWPDFGPVDLYKSIIEYQGRERRFGDVGRE